jgi:hypothetical protein
MAFIILILFMEILLAILLPGPNMGNPYEVPFGYPPGGTELACVLGAVHRLRRQRRRASVPHIG